MSGNIADERNELQEDDEKFQTILHEFGSEWGYGSDEEEAEDEDHLLIDLDYENETSEPENDAVRSYSKSDSITPSFVGSGSQSNTAADEETEEVRPSLELPSQVDVAEYRADPLKTLHVNRVLQDILEGHINDIKTALQENKEKQKKLEEEASDASTKTEKKSMYAGVFRAPFFRHGHSYPPPNEDMVVKKASGDYEIVTPDSVKDLRYFNKTAKLLLKDAVFEDCLKQTLKPLVAKMESEIEKRDKVIDECEIMSTNLAYAKSHLNELQRSADRDDCEEMIDEVKSTVQELKNKLAEKSKTIKAHKEEIARLEKLLQTKKNTPQDEILATVDPEKVDWMKISKSHFSGHITWLDCQKAWENMLSPSINTAAWTKEEETKLLDLIKQSATNDWKEIAKDLGTGRTPFQCFSHSQQKFNSDLKPRPWTQEEDATLVRVTNNVKDSVGFFNWAKVSALVDSRSPAECMYRFTKVDPSQARGRFTQIEDAKLLAAVEMIGPCWSKVAKFIGTRNMVQCRDRYLNCLAPNINFSHFTYDEDVKLLKLRKAHGQFWSKMVPEFIGRTDSMLLNRYRQLQRWQRQTEWFDRQTDATKRMLLGKSLTVTERQQYRSKADDYMKMQLGVQAEDYKRRELDRQNNVDPDIIPPRPPRHLRCYSYGTSRKGSNLSRWSEKLDIHNRLTENLQKLLKREILASAAEHKGEVPLPVSEEVTAEIVDKTVEETLKRNKKMKPKMTSMRQVRKLEEALNKAFLTSGTVSVQELLKLSAMEKKKTKHLEKSTMIDSELKSIVRRRGRAMSKTGRARRFFEKDSRPKKVIEEELDECDQSVPLMLMKYLGTSVPSLCSAARHQCLDLQEELLNLPSYEEDPDFQKEEAYTQEAIKNLEVRPDGTVSKKQLRVLKNKLKSLREIYQEKIHLKNKVVENKISTLENDLEYLETLTGENGAVNKNISLMICNPPGISETAFGAEIIEAGSQSPPSSSSSTTPDSNIQINLSNGYLAQGQSPQQATAGESTSSASKSDHEFAVPLAPPIKQRKRRSSRFSSDKFSDESARKMFKVLSKEEIEVERKQLPNSKKKMFTNLPLLPPNLSTLLGLRALFLMKDDLKNRTQRIQREHQEATDLPDTTTEQEIPKDEDTKVTVSEDEPHEDTASWFLYTNLEQLCEQASKFKPYGRLGKVQPKGKHHFQTVGETVLHSTSRTDEEDPVAFETGTLMYPLEESGGHLPFFPTKNAHDCDNDAKPLVGKSLGKRRKEPNASKYEVVMDFSGLAASEHASVKNTKKRTVNKCQAGDSNQSSMQNNLYPEVEDNLSLVPVITNNLSLAPPTVIKAEPTTVSYNICNEDYNERIPTSATSNWGVSLQNNRSDAVYSVHAVDQNENNDDDDVVAVIHLDDDSNLTPTVINICSGQTNNMKSEIFETKDEESVIFSENNRPSQFMIIPPEPRTAENRQTIKVGEAMEAGETTKASELSSLELPKHCIKSIMMNKRLKNCESRIVLVGVDEESKRIVHFKSEDNKFKAYEAISTAVVEDSVGCPRGVKPGRSEYIETALSIPECLRALRKTDEYKMLLARFRALFMWPVFMSTVKPSPLNDGGPFPTRLRNVNPVNVQPKEKTKKSKKRHRSKMSASKRQHLRLINECSLRRRGKKVSNVKSGEHGNRDENMDVDTDAGVNVEPQVTVTAPGTGVSSEQVNMLTTQAESSGQGDVKMASVIDGQSSSANNDKPGIGSEDSKDTKCRTRLGRPKGSKNNKYESVLRKRSSRIKAKYPEDALPAEPAKEVLKVLPQWWKDAVLASMLAKKAIAEGQEENLEVRIDDDDEFLDTGNYSDDEWYQQLREEELKKAEPERLKEVGNPDEPDMETLASQDVAGDESVSLE